MAAGRTLGTNRPWPPPGGGHGHGRPHAGRLAAPAGKIPSGTICDTSSKSQPRALASR